MDADFRLSEPSRPWTSERTGVECEFYLGEGASSLEIIVAEQDDRPTKQRLQRLYKDRRGGRANPILIVMLYDNGTVADVCGPGGEDPPVKRDLDPEQIQRVCNSALDKPSRNAAQRFLRGILDQIDDDMVGLRNQGLLSTHELKVGVPDRADWDEATEQARELLDEEPRDLIEELGYEIERLSDQSHVLKDVSNGRETAVAVFLHEDESFEHAQNRFTNDTPVQYALNKADQKNLEYVIANANNTLRLYTTNPDAGFGSRGRTDTFVEINTDLLTGDDAGYLWLLFSTEALRDDGTLHDIMEQSKDYAASLGERLRERIYDDVVPDLAEAIADARDLNNPTKDELDETYRMALVSLYRLLFIAYAEDEGFLPRYNPRYEHRSLKQKAHELHDIIEEDIGFDSRSTTHWDDVMALTQAIHNGHAEWGLPEYDGTLLSSDPDITDAGGGLATIELTDDQFGPVLANLLVDETQDGYQGPVDFRNIGVREFGVIYEGLLESELSVADQPLGVDDDGHYEPVDPETREVTVEEGEVYLHGQSGERKATGTYYTKTRFVEHLLDHSLEPALDEHLERLDEMTDNEAAEQFFDIRVADISMGSGHFLVGAVDRIESRFSKYLSERTLPRVEEELDRLRETAQESFESKEEMPEVERSQLLRRQVARRCMYGADLNPLATELARLSLWVHTFVPGLPLTFLDYNLVTGDSLAGIGTLDEVGDILGMEKQRVGWGFFPGEADTLTEITEEVDHIGQLADADAAEVRAARETRQEIEQRLERTRAAFDILAASRIDEDIDPTVVNDDGGLTGTDDYERAQAALESTAPLHFPAAFPEVFQGDDDGFDVIIGNPPWEKTKVEEHEFWARHFPGLRSLTQSQREEEIERLEEERPDLVSKMKKERREENIRSKMLLNGPYPGIGSGDPDLYQAFSWRFWDLIRDNRHLGVVLPREAFLSKGSEAFRRHLLENGQTDDLTFILNNKQWAFENVHPQTTIGLISARKTEPNDETTLPIRGPYPSQKRFDARKKEKPHQFMLKEVMEWTDTASLPLLPPDPETIEVFDVLQQSPSIVSESTDGWKVVPYRTGITSSDCLNDEETEDYDGEVWPVYKGESFDIWNSDTGSYYGWGKEEELVEYLKEKRDRSRKWPDTDRKLPCFSPQIAFRRVTRATDRRTIRTALIPPNVFMRDADPFLLWERGNEHDEAYLIGVLSSIPTDWYARRFVEKHLDYYIFNGIPVPRPDNDSQLRERTIKLAGRLAAVDERYSDWASSIGVKYGSLSEEEKQRKVHELDAVVAHLYGLSRNQICIIYETFHENWDHEPRLNAVLEHYDDWAEKLDREEVEATDD